MFALRAECSVTRQFIGLHRDRSVDRHLARLLVMSLFLLGPDCPVVSLLRACLSPR